MKKQKWEIEFDKKYLIQTERKASELGYYRELKADYKNIKQFIKSLQAKTIREVCEKIRKEICVEIWCDGCLQDLDRVLNKILKEYEKKTKI